MNIVQHFCKLYILQKVMLMTKAHRIITTIEFSLKNMQNVMKYGNVSGFVNISLMMLQFLYLFFKSSLLKH